jgi:hypothetical protein
MVPSRTVLFTFILRGRDGIPLAYGISEKEEEKDEGVLVLIVVFLERRSYIYFTIKLLGSVIQLYNLLKNNEL